MADTTALVATVSTLAKAAYTAQFVPWAPHDLQALDVPLNRAFPSNIIYLRNIFWQMPTNKFIDINVLKICWREHMLYFNEDNLVIIINHCKNTSRSF